MSTPNTARPVARRSAHGVLPLSALAASLLLGACTEGEPDAPPPRPIDTAEAAQTVDADLTALVDAVAHQVEGLRDQPRFGWMAAMGGFAPDDEDLDGAAVRSSGGDALRRLRTRVLTESARDAAAEAAAGPNVLVYRVPADFVCEGRDALDCEPLPADVPVRLHVLSREAGELEIAARVGASASAVATLTLTAESAELTVDLAAAREAGRALSGEDARGFDRDVPAMSGRVSLAVAFGGEQLAVRLEAPEGVQVDLAPDDGRGHFALAASSASLSLEPGAPSIGVLDFGGLTAHVEGLEAFAGAPVDYVAAPVAGQVTADLAAALVSFTFTLDTPNLLTLSQAGREVGSMRLDTANDGPFAGRFSVLDDAARKMRFVAFSGFSLSAALDGLVDGEGHTRSLSQRVELEGEAPALVYDDETYQTVLEAGRLTAVHGDEAPLALIPGTCDAYEVGGPSDWLDEVVACPAE